MEATLTPDHTHTHTDNNTMINLWTALFIVAGFTFHLMASPAQVFDIVFRVLSCVPVLMAIIINSPKFSAQIKKWRTKRKRKGG